MNAPSRRCAARARPITSLALRAGLVLCALLAAEPERSAADAEVEPGWTGRPLAEALDQLQRDGLRLLYSSRLVTPELRVLAEPLTAQPRTRLRELLAPLGLEAREAEGDWLVVVRRDDPAPWLAARVGGRVMDSATGRAIGGARVELLDIEAEVRTDAEGRFLLESVPTGVHLLRVALLGYVVVGPQRLSVLPGDDLQLQVDLQPIGATREEIVVRSPESGSVIVELPVHVTSSGRPVRGLGAADFVVRENGREREIVDLRVVDLRDLGAAVEPGSAERVPESGRRHFLLVFDTSELDPHALRRARRLASSLMREGLHRADLVGVAVYSPWLGTQVVLSFTSDHGRVEAALSSLNPTIVSRRWTTGIDGDLFPVDRYVGDPGARSLAAQSWDVGPDELGEAIGSDMGALHRQSDKAWERHRGGELPAALQRLAGELSTVAGRKHLIFLSDGAMARSFETLAGAELPEEFESFNRAVEGGELWKVDGQQRYPNSTLLRSISDSIVQLLRADCTFHTVDFGSVGAGAGGILGAIDPLEEIAERTGGGVHRVRDDANAGLAGFLEATSVTYLLSVRLPPPDGEPETDFRPLEVEVPARPGARVTHRPGVFAGGRPRGNGPAAEGGLLTSVVALPGDTRGRSVEVSVLIEIHGLSGLPGAAGGTVELEVQAVAFDGEGKNRDAFTRTLALDLEKLGPALEATGLRVLGRLDLPRGDYLLSTVVRGTESGAHNVSFLPLVVPEPGAMALSPPLFAESQGGALVVAAGGRRARSPVLPLRFDGMELFPDPLPTVEQTGEAAFLLLGYNLPPAEGVAFEARLVDPAGRPLDRATVDLSGKRRRLAPGLELIAGLLRLGGTPPGAQRLEVVVRAPDGSVGASSSIQVRVAGRSLVAKRGD